MSLDNTHSKYAIVDATSRFALYVEGQLCAFTQIQLIVEDGIVPRLAMTLPATQDMAQIARRCRIHVLHREMVHDEWVVLFEGEMLQRGFAKSPNSRDLTFMAYHVMGLFEDFTLTSLDPAAANLFMMKGQDLGNPMISTATGNLLDAFTPVSIKDEIDTHNAANPDSALPYEIENGEAKITFSHFVFGSFLRYQRVVAASRVAKTHGAQAVALHQLIRRVTVPNPNLIDWQAFYSRLMGAIFTQGVAPIGGKISFLDLLRLMSSHFLHQLTFCPNAESFTKQLQIKPQTMFNAIPRCNVIYSSLADNYEFSENFQSKPTRMEAHFYPMGFSPNQEVGVLGRYFTVYAPNELQWRWNQIALAHEAEAAVQNDAVNAANAAKQAAASGGLSPTEVGGDTAVGEGDTPGTAGDSYFRRAVKAIHGSETSDTRIYDISHAIVHNSNFTVGRIQTDIGQRDFGSDGWVALGFTHDQVVQFKAVGDRYRAWKQGHGPAPSEADRALIWPSPPKGAPSIADTHIKAHKNLVDKLDFAGDRSNLSTAIGWLQSQLKGLMWTNPSALGHLMDIVNQVGHITAAIPVFQAAPSPITSDTILKARRALGGANATDRHNAIEKAFLGTNATTAALSGDALAALFKREAHVPELRAAAPAAKPVAPIAPVAPADAKKAAADTKAKQAVNDGNATAAAQTSGKLEFKPPTDGIPFLTREEEARGISSAFYDIPPVLNYAIMSLVTKPSESASSSGLAAVAAGQEGSAAATALKSNAPDDRLLKYKAFLCMALGSGYGIDSNVASKLSIGGTYRSPGKGIVALAAPLASPQLIVPKFITLVGLAIHPTVRTNEKGLTQIVSGVKGIAQAGVNYFITKNGTIVEALKRSFNLFSEPSALPYGVVLPGLSDADALKINRQMPPLGISKTDAKAPVNFSRRTNRLPASNLVMAQVSKQDPVGASEMANQPLYVASFPQYTWLGNDTATQTITLEEFGRISKGDTVIINQIANGSAPARAVNIVTTVADKGEVGDNIVAGTQTGGHTYWFLLAKNPAYTPRAGDLLTLSFFPKTALDLSNIHPFKPWVLMGETPTGLKVDPLSEGALQGLKPVTNFASVAGGNTFNCAIGFETDNGTLVEAQIQAAGYIIAAMQELTAHNVGGAKDTVGIAERKLDRTPTDIRQASDYFKRGVYTKGATGWIDLAGSLARIKAQALLQQQVLYADFNRWDAGNQAGVFQPIGGGDTLATTTASDNGAVGGDNASSLDTGLAAVNAANTAVQPPKTVNVDVAALDSFIKNYASAVVNFQYFNARYAGQGFTGNLVFNPFLMAGYPCLLLDDSDANFNLVGYVHSAVHVVTPESAYTQATYSHVRNARSEKIIPYSKSHTSYFQISDPAIHYGNGPEAARKDLENYKDDKGQPFALTMDTFLPIELMDVQYKHAPPFVYDGGFGFSKAKGQAEAGRDFSEYARFIGYVDEKGAPTASHEADFVFADDADLNFSDASAQALKEDIDTVSALKAIYRKIQKVGQNDPLLSQASRVAFGTSADIEVPEQITVYAALAGEDVPADGPLMKFDGEIQKIVAGHTELVKQRRAVPG